MPPESPSERVTLATRLKEAREYLGLSQEEVARILQVPRTAISLMENAERSVAALELKRLAELYQRPVEYFTGTSKEKTPPEEIVHLARTASKLGAQDREELLRFAEFLQSKAKPGRRK